MGQKESLNSREGLTLCVVEGLVLNTLWTGYGGGWNRQLSSLGGRGGGELGEAENRSMHGEGQTGEVPGLSEGRESPSKGGKKSGKK